MHHICTDWRCQCQCYSDMSKNLHFVLLYFQVQVCLWKLDISGSTSWRVLLYLSDIILLKVFCQVITVAQWPRYIIISVIRYYNFSHCGSVISSILLSKVKKMHDEWCHFNVTLLPVLFCNWKFKGHAAGLPSADKLVLLCSEKWMNWSYLYYYNGSWVFSVLDSGAEGSGFKSQSRRCRVTVLDKLFTPITKQQNW